MAYEAERWKTAPGTTVIMCSHCKHIIPGLINGKATCKAYPDGIPRELMLRNEHNTPFPGDNGIRFEAKEEEN